MADRKLPPISGRFRKGRSGNPKGRPKKEKPQRVSAFDILIDKTLTVTHNGVPREMTVEEALLHRTYQDAISGKRSAQRAVLKMIAQREKAFATKAAKNTSQPAPMRIEPDPDNADLALRILGIAAPDAGKDDWPSKGRAYLLLEPWAVQAALDRRRGGARLTAKDVADIKRCTRDAENLRWPRGTEG